MRFSALSHGWDVVVVGAGVAGSLAAFRLSWLGLKVLLVEKSHWPRHKACGGCVNAATLGILEMAGLAEISEAGRSYSRMRLANDAQRADIPLPAGRAISRYHLDALLVDRAIAAGACFVNRTRAVLSSRRDQSRDISLYHEHQQATVTAKLILACDGLGSRLLREENPRDLDVDDASPIGLGTIIEDSSAFYAPGTIHMACGRHGYVGLVRVEYDLLNIGAALDPSWLKRQPDPAQAVTEVLEGAAFPLIRTLREANWQGTPRLRRQRQCLGSERVLVLGDSAGYEEPFTGEGMGWALAGVLAAEPVVLEAMRGWQDDLVQRWTALHGDLIQARQRRCRGISKLLRSQRLLSSLLPLIDVAPGMITPLTSWLNRAYRLQAKEG